ncbi:uncharacterized protein [Nicotiana tomentosiformis]|uniref:uncharacterized protein n=1 Tax=Nicotiana tomentosiformis TaxID=4098 RepID=UPI00388CD115
MMIDNLSKELDGVTDLRHLGGAIKIEKGSLQTPQVGDSHVVGGYDDRTEKSIGGDGKMGEAAIDDDDGDCGMHFNDDNGRGSNYDDGRGVASMKQMGDEIKDRVVMGIFSIHCPCICPDFQEKEKEQIKWRDDMQCQLNLMNDQLNSMHKTMDDLVQKLSKRHVVLPRAIQDPYTKEKKRNKKRKKTGKEETFIAVSEERLEVYIYKPINWERRNSLVTFIKNRRPHIHSHVGCSIMKTLRTFKILNFGWRISVRCSVRCLKHSVRYLKYPNGYVTDVYGCLMFNTSIWISNLVILIMRHMEDFLSLMRIRHRRYPKHYDQVDIILDCNFLYILKEHYKTLCDGVDKVNVAPYLPMILNEYQFHKDDLKYARGEMPFCGGRPWNGAKRIFCVYNIERNHYVTVVFLVEESKMLIYDCNTYVYTDEKLGEYLYPIGTIFPRYLRSCGIFMHLPKESLNIDWIPERVFDLP